MKQEWITIDNLKIPVYHTTALVIGSGCAGYNGADWLYDLGVEEVALVTEGRGLGTSRNTGSDKQTYYKLSLSSAEEDGVLPMAKTLFAGKGVHGDIALAEAAGSVKSFMKLVNLGVPFPTNDYGEYVGYQTDHDDHRRATSAGPLTSRYMTEALEKNLERKKIPVLDHTLIVQLLTKDGGIVGALGINKQKLYELNKGIVVFLTPNILLATGGPAGIYRDSVYPLCHKGMSGLALEAGAAAANLQEWQYGLASVGFRWNVSGTYQQVMPRYISVDENGAEREFLLDTLSAEEALGLIFQKGYQWPFDTAKLQGSSRLDLLIYQETVVKKNKVYMDFRREPTGLEGGFSALSKEAYDYLERSGALVSTPIARLERMNPKAIELYRSHGIDLYQEPLQVAVCAQHNNGGIGVDCHWQTNIEGLYAAGEVAGTFGVYRPGGSALNSTQVGSMRAAETIAKNPRKTCDLAEIEAILKESDELRFIAEAKQGKSFDTAFREEMRRFPAAMSEVAAYLRRPTKMKELQKRVQESYRTLLDRKRGCDVCDLLQVFRAKDMLLTQNAVLSAMLAAGEEQGTRGGALVCETLSMENISLPEEKEENPVYVTRPEKGSMETKTIPAREIPCSEVWFETVWNQFEKDRKR